MSLFNEFLAKFGLKSHEQISETPDLVILEERVLYNAAPFPIDVLDQAEAEIDFAESDVPTPIENLDSGFDEISAALESLYVEEGGSDSAVTSASRELVVVDTSVEGYQRLIDDILNSSGANREFEILVIDQKSDGIEQLTTILAERRGIDALHLVTHGSAGSLQLGNGTLDSATLNFAEDQISEWKYALNRDADILIYGCDVGGTSEGVAFLGRLSEITETDIAASDDRTGHSSLGSDWDLEVQVGTVETAAAFSLQVQSEWIGELFEYESGSEDGSAAGFAVDDSGNRYFALTVHNAGSDRDDVYVGIQDQYGASVVTPFIANTTTAGNQKWATVAVSDAANRFVVVWTSDDMGGNLGVYAAVFDIAGNTIKSEFQVDLGGSNGNDASVGMADDGSFVIAWEGSGIEDADGIYARQYDLDGNATGAQFSVNDGIGTVGLQSNPDIAVQGNGEFIVAWDNYQDSDTESQIFYRKYDAFGSAQFDGATLISAGVVLQNASLDVADNGVFVISSETEATDTMKSNPLPGVGDVATDTAKEVTARIYDASGNETDSFVVNQTGSGLQEGVTALIFDDGSTAFSWEGVGNAGEGLYFREFDNAGVALADEARMDGSPTYDSGTDLSSPIRGASILDPNDPSYQVWNELINGVIVKTSGSTFIAGMSGAGYNNDGQLVEGFHIADGTSFGDKAPTIDPTPADVALFSGASNGTVVFDIEATDDMGSTLVYSIVAGDINGVFSVDSSGVITVVDNTTLNSLPSYQLVVAVTDNNGTGLSVAKTINIGVNDLEADSVARNLAEDVTYTLDSADFTDKTGDTVTRIRIDTIPLSGILLFNGNAVTVGQELAISDIAQGKVTFVPNTDSDENVAIGFRIGDSVSFASQEATLSLNFAAVADENFVAVGDQVQSLDGPSIVNETVNGTQQNASLAALDGGGYVVTWQSTDNDLSDGNQGTVIYQQLYDSDGNKAGGETRVDESRSGNQIEPSVIGLDDGGYLIVWTQNASGQTDVVGQRFDANGNPVEIDGTGGGPDTEFLVHAESTFSQYGASIEKLSGGGFVIAWSSGDPAVDGDEVGVAARIFNSNGVPGTEFSVNDISIGKQRDVEIAALKDNRFVIGWVDQNVNDFDVKAKVFDAGDPFSGTEFTINTDVNDRQSNLDLTALTDGRFLATWQSTAGHDGAGRGVFGQLYDAFGNPMGGEFVVNETTAGHQWNNRVVALSDGGFVSLYQSGVGDVDGEGVFGRRFDASAAAIGSEFQINGAKFGDQSAPQAVLLADGKLVVTWEAADGDNLGGDFDTGIFIDRFEFAVRGDEGAAIPLGLNALLKDSDTSESFSSIVIAGVPAEAIVFDGIGNSSTLGDANVDVTSWDLATIQIIHGSDLNGDFTLQIQTTTSEVSNGDLQLVSQDLKVIVNPTVDGIDRPDFSESTTENSSTEISAASLNDSVNNPDSPVLAYPPATSFDQSTLPPAAAGPNLVWSNALGGGTIVLDPTVDYLTDSGSDIPGLRNAFQFDGTGAGVISDSAISDVFQSAGGIELWIKPASVVGQFVLFEWGDADNGITLYQDGDKILLNIHMAQVVNGYTTEPYTLIAEGLDANEFNQIYFSIGADATTPLGDQGATPDVQLFLNGQLADQLADLPGYSGVLDFSTLNVDAGLGQRVGAATAEDAKYTNYEGLIARFEVFDSVEAAEEVEARYWFERSVPEVVLVEGQAYEPGTLINLASTAQLEINADGSLTYHPNGAFLYLDSGEIANDSFNYEIRNANGETDLVTVTVQVNGIDPVSPIDLSSGVEINTQGNDAYFLAANGNVLGGLNELTVEVMFNSSVNSDTPILSYQTTDQANGATYHDDFLIIYQDNGTLDIYLPGNAGSPTISGLAGVDYSVLMDGSLSSLAFSWNGTNGDWVVYVDGVVTDQGSGAAVGESLAGGGQLVFGQDQDSPNGDFDSTAFFQGTYHDVRIWDHERSEYEVAANHANKIDGASIPSGLLANWQFDGLTGANDTVVDIVDPANNLVVNHIADVGFTAGLVSGELKVVENASLGTQIGYVVPTDSDGQSQHTFSLVDDAGGRFDIDLNTGEITVLDPSLLNFELATSHTIIIQVTDVEGESYQESVTVQVLDINEQATVGTNTGLSIKQFDNDVEITNLHLNEGDPDASDAGDQVTYTLTSLPTNGQLRVGAVVLGIGGTFTQADIDASLIRYDHTALTFDDDSFAFTIEDGLEDGVGVTAGTFIIQIAMDNPPTAGSKPISVVEDSSYTIQESDFAFSDVDGDTFDGILVVTAPTNGELFANGVLVGDNEAVSLSVIQNNQLVFVPAADEFGSNYATLEFRVKSSSGLHQSGSDSFTFNVLNDGADLEVQDDSYLADQDTTYNQVAVGGLLQNDDADSGTFSVLDYSQPTNGSVVVNSDGSFSYIPAPGFYGNDSFEYAVTTGAEGLVHHWGYSGNGTDSVGSNHGTLNGGIGYSQATFGDGLSFTDSDDTVDIPDVSYTDDFTLTFKFRMPDNSGTSYDYIYSHGAFDTPNSLNIYFANDSAATNPGKLVTAILDSNDGGMDYNALSIDSAGLADGAWHTYTLTLSDAEGAKVYIDGVEMATNAAPTEGVLDPTGTVVLGTRSDRPDLNYDFSGELDTMQLYNRALDPAEVLSLNAPAQLSATVSISVAQGNVAPVVYDNVYGIEIGGSQSFSIDRGLLYNASDENGDSMTVSVGTGPANGTLTIELDGTFTYTHDGSPTSTDSFTYVVSDGNGGASVATVQLHIDSEGLIDGNEFVVNQNTTSHPHSSEQLTAQLAKHSNSSVAVNDNGDYVVIWSSEGQDGRNDLMMRMYDFSGRALARQVEIGQATDQSHFGGSVDMDSNGNFVVSWIAEDDSGEYDIYARRFDANGNALGAEFRVTDNFNGGATTNFDAWNQLDPAVSVNSSGDFVVAWSGARYELDGSIFIHDIYMRKFAADGSAEEVVVVNAAGVGYEFTPAVVLTDAGDAVLAWDDTDGEIHLRTVFSDGSLGTEFQVPTTGLIESASPSLDVHSSGLVALSYHASVDDGLGGTRQDIFLQVVDPTNPVFQSAPIASQFQTGDQASTDVSFNEDGSILLTWHGQSTTDINDGNDVFGRRFRVEYDGLGDPYAQAISDEFVVSQSGGSQLAASVSSIDSENFVVVWVGPDTGSSFGIYARQFGNQSAYQLSGSVLEDVNGDADLADADAFANAVVKIYREDGVSGISSGDRFITQVTTDANGNYVFDGLQGDSSYWVVVDSTTLNRNVTLNSGYEFDDLWAEQTYGDGGAKFGGLNSVYGGSQDDATSLLTAEHVSGATFTRGNTLGIDFGFSFNVVVNSDDSPRLNFDADGDLDRAGQGTLRQFLLNANALDGGNEMRFVPVTTSDRLNLGNRIWEVEVYNALPTLTDEGTVIDGRAYSTDGTNFSNANASTHGYGGHVGLGDDALADTADDYVFVQIDAPELEIADWNGVASGLHIQAADTEIRYVSIHGFGVANTDGGNIFVDGEAADNVHIHHNMIGSRAHEFSVPNTAASQTYNIFVVNADNGVIENNLIAFAGFGGIKIQGESDYSEGANDWAIRFNEIRDNARVNPIHDGIDFNYDSRGASVYSNLIIENGGYGIDTWRSLGEISISNNSILSNGSGGVETGGVRIFGDNNFVEQNVIAENTGNGVHVVGYNSSDKLPYEAATNNLISQNSFYENSGMGIDLSENSASQSVLDEGDGYTPNDSESATSGNTGFNSPVLTAAVFDSGVLHVSFQSNSSFESVEVYVADPTTLTVVSGQEYGQGAIYLGTFLVADLTFTSFNGTYTGMLAAPTGGWPVGVTSGKLTAIAIDKSNNTSEFGSTIGVDVGPPEPTAIDSNVVAVEDTPYVFAEDDFLFSDVTDTEYLKIRIESLPGGGILTLNGVVVKVGDEILATQIDAGSLVYMPAADQFGVAYDSFQFSVNDGLYQSGNNADLVIDVRGTNDAPTIDPPHQITVVENNSFVYDIDGGDKDGDALYYTIQGGANSDLFDIDSTTGVLTFKNAPDYDTGSNEYDVVVRANDGNGGIVDQAFEVLVTNVNDNDPTLVKNRIGINEGTTVVPISFFDADLPAENVTASLIGGPDASLFTFDPIGNVLTFNQVPDFENPHDSDGDNRYLVTFELNDGNGRTSVETLLIRVRDVVEAPIAGNDSYSLQEGDTLNGSTVLWNDSYSSNVFVTLATPPAYGGLTLNTDGTFTYVHGGAEIHNVTFVYQVSDDTGLVDTGTVVLRINPVDDAPEAFDDSILTVGDLAVDITDHVLGNDVDVDSAIDGIQIVSQPSNGNVFINSSGKLIFVPDAEFDGVTRFEYQITSGDKISESAVVVIEVTPPPTQPADPEEEVVEDEPETTDPEEGGTTPDPNNDEETDATPGNVDNRGSDEFEDSLADIRNSESVFLEIEEINLDSNGPTTIATYVYTTDVNISESATAYRNLISTVGVSQFDSELMATSFLNELDAAKNQFYAQFDITMPSLAMAGTSFLTVGYLAWMVRGGILLTTFMSSIPAWRMLDPLAVLESVQSDDAQDDQSIGQLVDN